MLNLKKLLDKLVPRFQPTLSPQIGYVDIAGVLICWGRNTQDVSSSSEVTWDTTFPRTYAVAPAVFTQIINTNGSKAFSCVVNNITTRGCTFKRGSILATSYSCTINWVAIGKAA